MKLNFSCIVTAFALSSSFTLFSQNQPSVIKTYGGPQVDYANDLIVTGDGGYLLSGQTQSFGAGGADAYLIKTDDAGTLSWSSTYGSANNEVSTSVLEAEPGNYLVAGWFMDAVNLTTHAFIFKIDPSGDTLWTRVLERTDVNPKIKMVRTPDNVCILIYSYFDLGFYSSVIRFGSGGNVIWNKIITDPSPYPSISANHNEILILYGGKNIIRMDMNGNVINARKIFTNPSSSLLGVVIRHTPDGGYLILGRENYNNIYFDSRLIKVDSNDVVEWSYTASGNVPPYTTALAYDVMAVNDSCYIVLGGLTGLSGGTGPEITYLTNSGQVLWCKRLMDVLDANDSYHLVQHPDGNIGFNPLGSNAKLVLTELNAFPFCQAGTCMASYNFDNSSYTLPSLPLALPDGNLTTAHYPMTIDINVSTQEDLLCNMTGLSPEEELIFSIYPNPGNGTYYLELPENIGQADLRIRNISGQEIMHLAAWTDDQAVYLDAAPGMYFVEISTGDNLYTGKIIHMR